MTDHNGGGGHGLRTQLSPAVIPPTSRPIGRCWSTAPSPSPPKAGPQVSSTSPTPNDDDTGGDAAGEDIVYSDLENWPAPQDKTPKNKTPPKPALDNQSLDDDALDEVVRQHCESIVAAGKRDSAAADELSGEFQIDLSGDSTGELTGELTGQIPIDQSSSPNGNGTGNGTGNANQKDRSEKDDAKEEFSGTPFDDHLDSTAARPSLSRSGVSQANSPPSNSSVAGDSPDSLAMSIDDDDRPSSKFAARPPRKSRQPPQLPPQVGDYEIGELLGSGGMGHVYVARHTRMQRKVALKVLPADWMRDENSINRFYEEVRAAGRLMHPNIVTALDAGEDHGVHYLVMEYVDGVTLTTLVDRSGPLSVGEASGIIRQAAMGLLYAHRAGIIHRDVKPANVMQSIDGTIKLLDMGLARIHRPALFAPDAIPKPATVTGRKTATPNDQNSTPQNPPLDHPPASGANPSTGSGAGSSVLSPSASSSMSSSTSSPVVSAADRGASNIDRETGAAGGGRRMLVGTLPYMAPEQLEESGQVDYRADIYSLGATLHFLLTGRSPFTGPYIDQVYGHRHGPIPDLMSLRDDIELDFANIFERMMAKRPSERYQSLDEVIESLARYATASKSPDWLSEFNRSTGPTSDYGPYSGNTSHQYAVSGGTVGQSDDAWIVDSGQALSDDVLGIDFGMFHAVAASCGKDLHLTSLVIESVTPSITANQNTANQAYAKLFRCMIASDESGICFGAKAMLRRVNAPHSVVHCVPLYIGMESVPRLVAGRRCPPEALMGLLLRHIAIESMNRVRPVATAITILGAYDQVHRRSILQSAWIANLPSVRLIDRSLACVASVVHSNSSATSSFVSSLSADSSDDDFDLVSEPLSETGINRDSGSIDLSISATEMLQKANQRRYFLYLGLDGQGGEAAILRTKNKGLKQIVTSGHWTTGTLAWLQRLVDIAAQQFRIRHGINVKRSLGIAAKLQMACEQAMLSMSILPAVTITVNGQSVIVERAQWLAACDDLIGHLRSSIRDLIKISGRDINDLDVCVAYGPLLRMQVLRRAVLKDVADSLNVVHVDRDDAARGAAICVSSQLPGRTGHPVPPRSVASQSLGLVIEDAKGRRRILPMVTRGTILPTRASRRITVDKSRTTMTITVAESSGLQSRSWQTLGKHEIAVEVDTEGSISRTLSFEVDINGILTIRVQGVGGASSTKMENLPRSRLSENDLAAWRRWVATK